MMADSLNLITAQISFLEPRVVLVHIPIEHYSFFIQPILRLLFGEDHDEEAASIPWTNRHDFLNVSITPVECSIICSRDLADRLIQPLVELFSQIGGMNADPSKNQVQAGQEDYIVIQVDGQGLDAGQRVLELTSPLAMAGISIFFLTTYFSDYILVPARSRHTVTKALQQRGFVFSESADAFVSQLSPSSPTTYHPRPSDKAGGDSHSLGSAMPSTPPASDMPELQLRTFARLKQHHITPVADRTIRLVSCAGSREPDAQTDARLQRDLLQVLLSTQPGKSSPQPESSSGLGLDLDLGSSLDLSSPEMDKADEVNAHKVTSYDVNPSHRVSNARFLSITITAAEPISILLEHSLLSRLGTSLLGAKDQADALVPIILDLRSLTANATGIVCGVAGRLAQSETGHATLPTGDIDSDEKSHESAPGGAGADPIEISFLSTARAGTVVVKADQLDRALRALEGGMSLVP